MRPRGVGGLREAFVGREREIELLLATYRRAVERGEPHLVTIVGDAGVGKTRLVRELWAVLQDESPAAACGAPDAASPTAAGSPTGRSPR